MGNDELKVSVALTFV